MQCTGSALEVFRVFLRLGLTSLGGPVAHIGYYRAELIVRRQWLDEAAFADIVALCQFMPGPASSQTGPDAMPEASATPDTGIHRGFASVLRALFLALLLVVLPSLVLATGSHAVGMIAAFLGTIQGPEPHNWPGGLLATIAIFLLSFLLVAGLMPFWSTLRHRVGVQAALRGSTPRLSAFCWRPCSPRSGPARCTRPRISGICCRTPVVPC